jgi:hypothetical protein
MARAIPERELTVVRAGREHFAVAGEADDADVRRLLRETPMPGKVSLSLEREPRYFADAGLPGEMKHTIVARLGGRLVCAGSCAIRQRFVNGTPRRVGYLGGLRLDSRHAGRFDILRRGYEFFHELQTDSPADFYFTSIATDNERARRFLERSLPGMPRYEFLSEFVTVLLPAQHRLPVPNVAATSTLDEDELVVLLNNHCRHQQFAPCWSVGELTALKSLGLREHDFCYLRKQGRLAACAALWDQRTFKQTVIRGYAPWTSFWRPTLNAVARIIGAPRLPAVGGTVANAFVSHLAAAADEQIRLIAELRRMAAQRRIELLTLGFAANDPRLATLRSHVRCREYRSRLYVVRWPEIGGAARELDDRFLAPEVALL